MADYTPVTVDDFTTRFPRYASLDPDYLEALLVEAQGKVDDSWIEEDFKPATLYYMAHLLETEKGDAATAPGAIVSESFGPMSRSYAVKNGSVRVTSTLDGTEWGRRFRALRDANFPPVVVYG